MKRVFLLSPADCGGERARMLLREEANFDLARRLRGGGVPLGEVMGFLSGLYFRGKLAYARAFARPPAGWPGALVITPNAGLRPADEPIRLAELRRFARVAIDPRDVRYRRPLLRDARRLAEAAMTECQVVLLGSVATGKYVDLLARIFGQRLWIPAEFIGRGDMSRGGLLLRCVDARRELEYVAALGASRSGPRPPRLASGA